MRTQTKCTLSLCGMLIVEIFPVPFTALYGIYAIRKRPDWVPTVVERLYADKPVDPEQSVEPISLHGHDPLTTRRKCTIAMSTMLLVDVIVPFTVPFGLYIVRRRPRWFENVVGRLYADQQQDNASERADAAKEKAALLERKHQQLERKNFDFARSMHRKHG